MKKNLIAILSLVLVLTGAVLFISFQRKALAYSFPSTNDANKAAGNAPYVTVASADTKQIMLNFVNGSTDSDVVFEVTIDGVVMSSGTAHPVVPFDYVYPSILVPAGTTDSRMFTANRSVEVRVAMDGSKEWNFDWTKFYVVVDKLTGQYLQKASGDFSIATPARRIKFDAVDALYTENDAGNIEFWNNEDPRGIHFSADIQCMRMNYRTKVATIMFQYPAGWEGMTGRYVAITVADGGPKPTNDSYWYGETTDFTTAKAWCEDAWVAENFVRQPISDGKIVVR